MVITSNDKYIYKKDNIIIPPPMEEVDILGKLLEKYVPDSKYNEKKKTLTVIEKISDD